MWSDEIWSTYLTQWLPNMTVDSPTTSDCNVYDNKNIYVSSIKLIFSCILKSKIFIRTQFYILILMIKLKIKIVYEGLLIFIEKTFVNCY